MAMAMATETVMTNRALRTDPISPRHRTEIVEAEQAAQASLSTRRDRNTKKEKKERRTLGVCYGRHVTSSLPRFIEINHGQKSLSHTTSAFKDLERRSGALNIEFVPILKSSGWYIWRLMMPTCCLPSFWGVCGAVGSYGQETPFG